MSTAVLLVFTKELTMVSSIQLVSEYRKKNRLKKHTAYLTSRRLIWAQIKTNATLVAVSADAVVLSWVMLATTSVNFSDSSQEKKEEARGGSGTSPGGQIVVGTRGAPFFLITARATAKIDTRRECQRFPSSFSVGRVGFESSSSNNNNEPWRRWPWLRRTLKTTETWQFFFTWSFSVSGYKCLSADWMQPGCTLGFFAVERGRERDIFFTATHKFAFVPSRNE